MTFLSTIFGILAVGCSFGFIIFIHELGHYLTARAVNIRCPQFAIGFGPVIAGFKWRGTHFGIRAFPFGGYVLMNGEEPGDRSQDGWARSVRKYLANQTFPATISALLGTLDEVPESERGEEWQSVRDQVEFARGEGFESLRDVEGNFHDRSIPARVLVIAGGVIMNFICTFLLLWGLGFTSGLGSFYGDWSPVISQTIQDTPAAEAGIDPGDRLLEIDGRTFDTYLEAYHAIGEFPGTPMPAKWRKQSGEERQGTIRPSLNIGRENYSASEDGTLVLVRSSSQAELVGKKLSSHKREDLMAMVSALKPGDSYQVSFEGQKEAVSFELPPYYKKPRGQIGVAFGVFDVAFEKSMTGKVVTVDPSSPAAVAGLKPGDEVLAVGDLSVTGGNPDISHLVFGSRIPKALEINASLSEEQPLRIAYFRDGALAKADFREQDKVSSLQELGITLKPITTGDKLISPFKMIAATMYQPVYIAKLLFTRERSGKEIVENLQGPVGIMTMLYNFRDNGLAQFLFFLALLNAAIGAFNLMPIPALDGSRLFFLVLEGIRGKAIDPDKEAKIHMVGLLVLLSFVCLVTIGDIRRLFSSSIFVL